VSALRENGAGLRAKCFFGVLCHGDGRLPSNAPAQLRAVNIIWGSRRPAAMVNARSYGCFERPSAAATR
jgi:hypothetical protein